MVERRKGGETGIASVEWIEGQNVWAWWNSTQGAWSKPLFNEAMRLQPSPLSLPIEAPAKQPVLFVLNYRDGLKAAALMLAQDQENWSAAFRVKGRQQLLSTAFVTPAGPPFRSFDGLASCVDSVSRNRQGAKSRATNTPDHRSIVILLRIEARSKAD